MHSGVIIAGGRSTRFDDRDKAVADLAGTPMIRRVADRISPVVDELVVTCREDQVDAIEGALSGYAHPVRFAEDPQPDLGPLMGIRTGLAAADGEYAAVVACDMPFVDPDLIAHLLEAAAGHDAAVPRDGECLQVTQAVYRTAPTVAACDRTLDRGERSVLAALSDLAYVTVDADAVRDHASLQSFEDLNTREAFEAAAARLRSE